MAYTAVFYVNNRVMGSSNILAPFDPHSFVYVCPTCGEAWGRIFVSGGESQYWEVEAAACEKHSPQGVPEWGKVPGSFLTLPLSKRDMRVTAWARAIEHLPEGVLKREFEVTTKWYEGKLKDEQDAREEP